MEYADAIPSYCMHFSCNVKHWEDNDKSLKQTLMMTYVVSDLPVWSKTQDFDATVLTKLIQQSIGENEKERKSRVQIREYPKTAALFIIATVDVQERIWGLLADLRGVDRTEDRPDFQKLLAQQDKARVDQHNMDTMMHVLEQKRLDNLRSNAMKDSPVRLDATR